MSKISELGPITGANTRTEDLFVIVNLIQGDDGTKNITRKELVQAIQYEIFDRITITGGSISFVTIFSSTIDNNVMNNNEFNAGSVNSSEINDSTINDGAMIGTDVSNVEIVTSDFSDGTGNNNIFTNTIVDNGQLNNSTGNNDVFTNSTIDDSFFNNVTIDQGTANGLILTNIEIDELILEDAFISNSEIDSTIFANGSIADSSVSNVAITESSFSNGDIRDTDLFDVNIYNSRFSNGQIWDTTISNSEIIDTTANNIVITNSEFNDSTANNIVITNSEFNDGTGNNNVFNNTTLNTAEIANASFTGTMDGVVAENMTIGSSSSDGLKQERSEIFNSNINEAKIANSTIDDSTLVDFDMDLKKVFEEPIDEDSYFALKNQKTGETERMTYRQLYEEVSRKTEKALKVYVASDGDDNDDGTLLKPVKTLKRASELAIEKAGGNPNRNDINNAIHISCGPGTYYVDEPIVLPDDCAMTSTAGQYATVIQKKPGWEKTNGILVGSGCYVQGFAYMNFEVDNFDQPEGGFAIAYRPGALMRRSPYIRDSSQLSNFNREDVEAPLNPFNSKGTILDLGQEFYLEPGHSAQTLFEVDDEVTFSSGATGFVSYVDDIASNRQIYVRNLKGNVEPGDILYAQRGGTGTVQSLGIDDFPNRLVGRGGGCLLADRAVLDTDSLYTYVLCFGFTPRTQNGTGYVAKNGAGVNGIGSLSIFTRQAFFALDGGQMTLNNSGSQFGDISMRARGSTVIIKPAEANDNILIANTDFADAIAENKTEIIDDMIHYLTANTSTGYNGNPGLGYQGYNADKCFRDTGIIVDNTGYDIATNSNYWGRLNGITYRSPISYVVVNEQLTETVGSIEHLKGEVDFIFENANSEITTRSAQSLNETLNILQNGEEFASPIIFADTGNGSGVAARELVQDNREFIIEEFIDWLDNNDDFYAYDSAKCQRDVKEYILPAVKYDTMLGTNYNSVTAGYAYYFNAAKNVIGAQREETVAAYERLRKSTDNLIQANSAAFAVDAYSNFNEIVNVLKDDGKKFTPTDATYATDGTFVITIENHGLTVGRYITLMPESFTFSCDTDGNVVQLVHPRKTDKAFKSALPITAVTTDTITVNVGATAYAGVHTLVDVEYDAVSVLGSAITFSDNPNIPVNKRNARKQLQNNREFVQDYMMNWADDEWFFYDSGKCQRDMKSYIVPAVLRDMQTGTNFNSIQSGIAYRGKTAKIAVTDQLTETVGALAHLKSETVDVVDDAIVADRIGKGYDEVINIMQTGGRKYTPTDATYDPATGEMVLTLNNHTLETGDEIYFEENAVTFSCANTSTSVVTEISHPRSTDPLFRTPVAITGTTSDTVTLNVGNAGGYTEPHTFVRAKLNGVRENSFNNGSFTPTAADYDPVTGVMEVTIGAHDLRIGETVKLAPLGITFSCLDGSLNAIEISHPRTTDPAYEAALPITAVTATTITLDVGNAGTYTQAHTFVSALPDAIQKVEVYNGKFTPSDVDYNPVTGDMTMTIGQHNLPVGKWISIADSSITLSCANNSSTLEISHPRPKDPAYREPVRITGITGTTITVNVGNANGYANNHTFVSAEVDCIDSNAIYWTDAAKIDSFHTPGANTSYDPVSGAMVIDLGADHGFTTDDHIEFKPNSLTFSCANGASIVEISHPRIGEPNYQMPLEISAVDATTITVNPGNANGYANNHTFVSAEPGSLVKMPAGVTREGKLAASQLIANKKFLQDEVDAWLRDNYFVYDNVRCSRDTGLILDAVRRDMATNSNTNAVFAGLAYRSGNASTESVIANELTETVGSIQWLKGQINTNITSGDGTTRADAAFDEIIDIMQNDIAAADIRNSGSGYHTDENFEAGAILQANKAFIVAETTAWIANTYPTYTYDSVKCERDVGYFVDAVTWDIQHGSNAATVNNSRLYYDKAVGVITESERTETAESFRHIANIAGQVVRNELITDLQQGVETQVRADNATFTPTGATYDPVTGVMEVTIGTHSYIVGDRVSIATSGITFECGSPATQISHPRVGDPFHNKPIVIDAITPTTITLQVGNAGGYTGAHTFVSAVADSIQTANIQPTYTPTDATYDPITGITVMTLGEHRFAAGDFIIMDEETLTFSCPTSPTDATPINISHPRATDPYWNRPCEILEVTGTTITIDCGSAQGYTGFHTFVSATANGIRKSAPEAVADEVVDLFSIVAKMIEVNDFSELPAIKEPPLSGVGYDSTINTYFEKIAGNAAKYQDEIIDFIRDEYNGLGYNTEKCYRDTGMVIDAVVEDMEYGGDAATANAAQYYFEGAINILPFEQRQPTKLAFAHLADVMEDVVAETAVTPTTGNTTAQNTDGTPANATTAARAKTLGLIVSDVVDNRLVIPDYTGSLDITQQTPDPLPLATEATKPAIEPSRTFARMSLQKNKDFIQDEVVAWINDEYFTYDEAKCARDVAYIIDAVKRDVQTGANYPSQYAGMAYRAGNAGTDKVIEEQLAETIEAIKYVRDDILPRLSGVPLTRATTAFANVISYMKIGSVIPVKTYGNANIGSTNSNATDGLQLNKAFLQAEITAWIDAQIAAGTPGFVGLTYDAVKCRRDTGYMVDAASYDIRHGSNVGMRDVANLYFENGVNVGLPADQRSATAQAFTYIATVAEKVVLKQTHTPTSGNAVAQVTTGFGNVVAGTGQSVQDLFEIVADVITAGSVLALPAIVEADVANGAANGYDYESDVAIIEARKSTLAQGVNDYLQKKFNYLEYDSVKCRRDVGYMVDAISHDIQYGGNAAMWNAAQIYFVNAVNLLPKEQREPTKKAFTRMGEVIHHVIRNEAVPIRTGRKYTPTTATYNPLNGDMVVTLGTHGLKAGDYIMFKTAGITFECGSPATEISHPRATDPLANKPVKIVSATSTTITLDVGFANGYEGAHTFVSALSEAVITVIGHTVKQDMNNLTARRSIAMEAKKLALMVADIADDNNPTNLPSRIEPHTGWMPLIVKTEKDKVDDSLETLVTSMINFISSEYKGISYPKEKCRRDVGIILDGLSFDVQHETNYATRLITNMYFDNAVSVLPFDQRAQTADFYERMGNVLASIVVEGFAGQDLTGTPATAVEGTAVQDLLRMVEEAIRRDSLDTLPEIIEPNTTWVDASKVWAAEEIDQNLDQLADDVTDFIADNFTIVDYSKAKCRRDSGYILDAMSWDLNYGGNLASKWNADFYFWNNELRIPENTRVATAQSYRQLGRIVSKIVTGDYAGQSLRPEVGSEEQAKQADSLGMIFYNALFYNTPRALGPTIEPNFEWEENKTFRFAKDILSNRKTSLQREVQRFITSEYKFIDLPKTYRDAGNLLKILQNDFRYVNPAVAINGLYNEVGAGADKATRSFAAALFGINAQHVFPVFNPPETFANWRKLRFKGTVENAAARDALTEMKRWDTYIIPTNNNVNRYVGEIWYWTGVTWASAGTNNTDLLYSFYSSWEAIRDYINNNIAPDQEHRNMVTELIDNVLIDSVIRPNFLAFGSLVESIAHQFNGASAGVNRNALPLNFRNIGAAIGATASVLSENGGRIRWSGSDELNNQYFARGLRINGRTGRIEGRPFTSSVRKLARRASNSRASL